MATYTTAALVKKRIENIDASLADADIEAHIEEAEQILNAIMGVSFLGSFDATKHGILRAGCNAWAAMTAIGFNPAGFTDLQEANTILEVLAFQWEQVVELLKERTYIAYLESL